MPKLQQLAKGKIIGTDDIHLEQLVPIDEDVPTSYVQKWDISEGANDRVTAYLTGTSSAYTLHVYGYGRMKNFKSVGGTYFYNMPWASYLYYNGSLADSRIRHVFIHNGVTNIASCFLCGNAMNSIYKSSSLSTLSIASTVREIGDNAFSCNIPHTINIPPGVRRIWNSAFVGAWDADNRTINSSVLIPDSVNHIDSTAFVNTSWWQSLTDEYVTVGNGCLIKYNGTDSNLVLPSGVKCVELYNTNSAEKARVVSIVLPETVRYLGTSAFNGFSSMTQINLPEGLKRIEGSAFQGCTSLTGITLPDTLKSINRTAFMNCTGMRHIFIPASVERVISTSTYGSGSTLAASQSPFYGCSNIKIYCEALSKPEGFDTYWNYISNSSTATVYWNVTRTEYEQVTGGD